MRAAVGEVGGTGRGPQGRAGKGQGSGVAKKKRKEPEPKRVVVIADMHCGHQAGLTHPDFNPTYPRGSPGFKLSVKRRLFWKYYSDTLAALKPVDVLVVNGDCVDGKGPRSGGTQLITADRNEQAEMAAAAILEAGAEKIFMSYGTPYHTGMSEDWEDAVAKLVNAEKISGNDWLDVNGLVINYRHYVGRSSIPHGRYTPVARERLWNLLWAEWGEYPKAHVIVRSHVHYFAHCGGFGWLGLTTPALIGYGDKYGTRQCSGTVDFGLISFDVKSQEDWEWRTHIWKPRPSRPVAVKV